MSNSSIQITVICTDELKEVISAELDLLQFDGIWDEGDRLNAYISSNVFVEKDLYNMLSKYGMENSYSQSIIEDKNWNEEWEANFKPFYIDNALAVRASFHPAEKDFKYEIVIDPKMSFGTGHHETTELMLRMMFTTEFTDKKVLDMGCGTGVLAILADKFGANSVTAIDNDINSVENASENTKYNRASSVECIHGGVEAIDGVFDVALSNITKNINKSLLPQLSAHVVEGGYVIISGFLDFDRDEMVQAALDSDLLLEDHMDKNKWQCLKLRKR